MDFRGLREGVSNIDTPGKKCHAESMANRQGTNVSLAQEQKRFVQAMVAAGRYQTVSEVVRDGLRLLEQAEHRRLLEEWLYEGLSEDEEKQLPQKLKDRAKAHFKGLVEEALEDVRQGRVEDGPSTMKRLRDELLESRRS